VNGTFKHFIDLTGLKHSPEFGARGIKEGTAASIRRHQISILTRSIVRTFFNLKSDS
jgi:hypothetical protein